MKIWLTVIAIALALAASLLIAPGCGGNPADEKVLDLHIWGEYIPDSVVKKFEKSAGCTVRVSLYGSNEELERKLVKGADCDVCVPSDYMIEILIKEKLLQPVDRSKVPNFKNVDERFLKQSFDPESKYTVPYFWGTTGLAYNKDKIKEKVDSWGVMFDEKYKGNIAMLDDTRECFAVALKMQGKSLNATDQSSLDAAAALLQKQKPLVKLYTSDDYDNKLKSEEVLIAHAYNGQIAKLAAEDPRFVYVIPKEGATRSMDCMVIPAGAKHVGLAHQFIDFVHDPQVNAEIANSKGFASTNLAARQYIKPELLNNPAIYPDDETLNRCESMTDIGPARQVMDKLWTRLKATD